MPSDEKKYWYNLATGKVEFGLVSPSSERAGPFDTEEEAARALQTMRERSQVWAEEEAAEDPWAPGGNTAGGEES